MKKYTNLIRSNWKQFFVASIVCLMIGSIAAQSNQVTLDQDVKRTYSFNSPSLETVDIAGTIYDRISVDDCYPAGSAGEPKIPSKGVFLLLPPESKVSGIEIITGEKVVLGSGFNVEPTSQAIPISQTENIPIPVPNQAIYQSNAAYPGKLFTQVGIQSFRGYQILVLLLHPVQYNPITGELFYYTSLEVLVQTVQTGIQPALYRGLSQDTNQIQQKVDNPEMIFSYSQKYPSSPASLDNYDLLIITTDALKTGFDPLKQAHDATGVATVIKTLTDIGGSDLESIRDYILTAYTDWGVEYVLIGGDDNIVPAPILWVSGMDENVTYYEDSMPADLYYACLDGPYNYDGDGNWGEPNDGTGGGDVDLVAEVYVGRACVGNAAEVTNFVTKTVAYINRDINDPYLKKINLAAEYLGDYGIASYGGTYMDQLVNGSTDDGYTTVGISSDDYVISKLYDSPSYSWPSSAIISVINNGVHVINHLGHASYDYDLKLDTYDVDGLTNPSNRTCFIYSQGCMAGGFDNGDCIAEHFTVKTTHAAFAVIMNARYGFFWSYSTDGDSQRLHRQFWDAVFGEIMPEIGRANHDSKEDNLPIIGRSCIRWCYYETNLFGDPALKITEINNNPPANPSVPSGPTSGKTGVYYTFSTSTTDPDADAQLFYQWDWGNEQSDWIGPYASGQSVQTIHKWLTAGDYQVKVRAKDNYESQSAWSDSITIQIVDGPQIEIGTISGGLKLTAEIKNTGIVDASHINWTITLQGLVLFGQEKSGTLLMISPGNSLNVSTGLVLGLGTVDITVTAADVEKTATAFLLGPFILNIR
ncbi:MAG TPA: C25 family cysteine peptidase [Candidatus Thermoplasmatota archaeon]|nr:C25 family cysteine peptidase [Candidatus Thermoplasmatota archaeon]